MAVLDKLEAKATASYTFTLPVGTRLVPCPVGPDHEVKYLILIEAADIAGIEKAYDALIESLNDAMGVIVS